MIAFTLRFQKIAHADQSSLSQDILPYIKA
jgi:hypothetical protein